LMGRAACNWNRGQRNEMRTREKRKGHPYRRIEGKQATHENSIMPESQVPTWSEELSGDHQSNSPPD
jgi:hypothetical protein